MKSVSMCCDLCGAVLCRIKRPTGLEYLNGIGVRICHGIVGNKIVFTQDDDCDRHLCLGCLEGLTKALTEPASTKDSGV